MSDDYDPAVRGALVISTMSQQAWGGDKSVNQRCGPSALALRSYASATRSEAPETRSKRMWISNGRHDLGEPVDEVGPAIAVGCERSRYLAAESAV